MTTTLKGKHPNSNAYAETMAAILRNILPDEETAASVYRTIRAREIPPVKAPKP